MPTPAELEKLKDPAFRDSALMAVADHYIHQPGVTSEELDLIVQMVPFLNGLRVDVAEKALDRVKLANTILPETRRLVGDILQSLGFDGSGGEETLGLAREISIESKDLAEPVVNVMHMLFANENEHAEELNLPTREFQAALARVGVETCIHLLLNCKDVDIRKFAKMALVYFSNIEMLSIGARTNSLVYSYVNHTAVNPELFVDHDLIVPIVDASSDARLKGALAFGQIEVKKVVPSGIDGLDFLYLDPT